MDPAQTVVQRPPLQGSFVRLSFADTHTPLYVIHFPTTVLGPKKGFSTLAENPLVILYIVYGCRECGLSKGAIPRASASAITPPPS